MRYSLKLLLTCVILAIAIAFRGMVHQPSRLWRLQWAMRQDLVMSKVVRSRMQSRHGLGSCLPLSRGGPMSRTRHFMTAETSDSGAVVPAAANETTVANPTEKLSSQNATRFNTVGYQVGQKVRCIVVSELFEYYEAKSLAHQMITISKENMTNEEMFHLTKKMARKMHSAEPVEIEITKIDHENQTFHGKYQLPARVGKRTFKELEDWGVNQYFNATVLSVNSSGLLLEMDKFDVQGMLPANFLPKDRPIAEVYPVNSTIKVRFQYLNFPNRVVVFELFEGRSDEEQANLARLPFDKWMQTLVVEVRANQLKVRPVATGVTEMVYINQIPLELMEVLMTRVSLDPGDKNIYNKSISDLEVIFNVGDVIQTRVTEVEEFPRNYLALTMFQKIPRPIPDPEQMHIYDATHEFEDVPDLMERDPNALTEEQILNPEGFVNPEDPSPSYKDYVKTMKTIAGLRQKPTIIDDRGRRQLHPFYETAKKPRDFQLGPKFNISADKREYYNQLKKLAEKGFAVGFPLEKITPEQEELARNSYTYDFSWENRIDLGNQEELPDPTEGKYIDYANWDFEKCMLWWRGKPFKKTVLYIEEEMNRHLTQHPDERIYYESPNIQRGAWARYIRSIEEPDDSTTNKELEAATRQIQEEIGTMEGLQDELSVDAVGYGIPHHDPDRNRLYRFLNPDDFPEEVRPAMTFYDQEEADSEVMKKHVRRSRAQIEESYQSMLNDLVADDDDDIDEELKKIEGMLDRGMPDEELDNYIALRRKDLPEELPEELPEFIEDDEDEGLYDDEDEGEEGFDMEEGDDDNENDDDNDNDYEEEEEEEYKRKDQDEDEKGLEGNEDEDDTYFPFDAKLDYWAQKDIDDLIAQLKSNK